MKLICTVALAVTVSGCATKQAVTMDGKALCAEAWKQINVQPGDKLTERTASAIEANNLAREGIGCAYETPKQQKVASKT